MFRWAKKIEGLRPPVKAVLLYIADYFNDAEGFAWPSQGTLAKETGYSRATIHRACIELEKLGYITKSKSMRKSGHFTSNRYKLHRVAECDVAECDVAESDGAMLQSASPPCLTVQQKHLDKPLNTTLNKSRIAKKERALSQKQEIFAEKMAKELINKYRKEHYSFESVLLDCRNFLLTDQTNDDWLALGNGLPNPLP